jgi:hypothetical protein
LPVLPSACRHASKAITKKALHKIAKQSLTNGHTYRKIQGKWPLIQSLARNLREYGENPKESLVLLAKSGVGRWGESRGMGRFTYGERGLVVGDDVTLTQVLPHDVQMTSKKTPKRSTKRNNTEDMVMMKAKRKTVKTLV